MDKKFVDQNIIDLYDDYVHTHFDRRLFMDRLAKYSGGMAAAVSILPLLQSNYALAAIVPENDPRIATERTTFKGATGEIKAYKARPAGEGKHGGIVVAHQNRGLNPHIEDIARRLAGEGYIALAVDFLSPLGGTPADEEAAMKLFAQLKPEETAANAVAASANLRAAKHGTGKVGVIGFCWGGGVVNQLAVDDPLLNAGVAYYGNPPKLDQVSKIKAPLLLNYADPTKDTRLGGLMPDYEKALKENTKYYELFYYTGAQHAFNDDTQSARYDEAAANLAWARTLAHFKKYVG